jgi:hypothetical protein
MLLGEGATRTRLQIHLECNGSRLVAKGDITFKPPRPLFRCMGHFARIMLCKPRAKILGDANLKVLAVATFDNAHISHMLPPHFRRNLLDGRH